MKKILVILLLALNGLQTSAQTASSHQINMSFDFYEEEQKIFEENVGKFIDSVRNTLEKGYPSMVTDVNIKIKEEKFGQFVVFYSAIIEKSSKENASYFFDRCGEMYLGNDLSKIQSQAINAVTEKTITKTTKLRDSYSPPYRTLYKRTSTKLKKNDSRFIFWAENIIIANKKE